MFCLRVHRYYSHLMTHSATAVEDEPGLGGKLVWIGDIDDSGRALVVAANIAGGASLCASADPIAQKSAIRDGVVDFVVTNLDEALRILKNEIRKRQPVAVCIAASAAEIETQMTERGVLPDLLRPSEGASEQGESSDWAVVVWMAGASAARYMPRLDALALECAGGRSGVIRRWLALAPRYLGRLAQSTHAVHADRQFASAFVERVGSLGQLDVPVTIQVNHADGAEEYHFGPVRN